MPRGAPPMKANVQRAVLMTALLLPLHSFGCSPGKQSARAADPEPTAELTMQAPRTTLTPTGGLVSSGAFGGPFAPTSRSFTWSNPPGASRPYQRVVTQPWLTTTAPSSGTLGVGQSLTFTVSLNSSQVASLPA